MLVSSIQIRLLNYNHTLLSPCRLWPAAADSPSNRYRDWSLQHESLTRCSGAAPATGCTSFLWTPSVHLCSLLCWCPRDDRLKYKILPWTLWEKQLLSTASCCTFSCRSQGQARVELLCDAAYENKAAGKEKLSIKLLCGCLTGKLRTWSFPGGLQFSQFADLILCDGRHIPPEVHVLSLLQLHVHLPAQHHSYSNQYMDGGSFKNNRCKVIVCMWPLSCLGSICRIGLIISHFGAGLSFKINAISP